MFLLLNIHCRICRLLFCFKARRSAAGNRRNKTAFFWRGEGGRRAQIMNKGNPVGACEVYVNPVEADFHPVLRVGLVLGLFVVDPRLRPCSNRLQQRGSKAQVSRSHILHTSDRSHDIKVLKKV